MRIDHLEFHPLAADETEHAVEWYAIRSPVAALRLSLTVEEALALIVSSPKAWPLVTGETRRFVLKRFPFSLVFREQESRIVVVAFAHAKRRPFYWRDRM